MFSGVKSICHRETGVSVSKGDVDGVFLQGTDTVNGLKKNKVCAYLCVHILYEKMYRVGVKSGVLLV